MREECIYIGIHRDDGWQVYLAESITEVDLLGVDVTCDLQATLVNGRNARTAKRQVFVQAMLGEDPYRVLYEAERPCRGVELVLERVKQSVRCIRRETLASASPRT
ncbi:MAG: hypothetical protein JWN04_5201 [Myxococcaceae bacterium]|nr:hypothetical protein [Myxococcaceae bacterium]